MAEFKAESASPFRANLYPNFDSKRFTKSTSCFSLFAPLPTDPESFALGEKAGSSASGDSMCSVFRTTGFAANELGCMALAAISSTKTKGTPVFVSQAIKQNFNKIVDRPFADDMFGPPSAMARGLSNIKAAAK